MRDLIKAVLLVSIIFFLLLFSIPYLSSGKNNAVEIPFIQKTFQVVNISIDWLSKQKIRTINFFWFEKDYQNEDKNGIKDFLSNNLDNWFNF
ncbi:MAG TPA: hypothetical protein PLE28_01810 [bacterium]|nr:hypothetical protein [bacterium]